MPTAFGTQPIRQVLRDQGRTIVGCARWANLDPDALTRAVYGKCRPTAEALDILPDLLGVAVEDLFAPDVLAFPHKPQRRRSGSKAVET